MIISCQQYMWIMSALNRKNVKRFFFLLSFAFFFRRQKKNWCIHYDYLWHERFSQLLRCFFFLFLSVVVPIPIINPFTRLCDDIFKLFGWLLWNCIPISTTIIKLLKLKQEKLMLITEFCYYLHQHIILFFSRKNNSINLITSTFFYSQIMQTVAQKNLVINVNQLKNVAFLVQFVIGRKNHVNALKSYRLQTT